MATPVHKGVLPLAFSMIDLSTIVINGVTAKPVQSPAIIYFHANYEKEEPSTLMDMNIKELFYTKIHIAGSLL